MSEDDERSDPTVQPAIDTHSPDGGHARLESLFRDHGSLVFRTALRVTGSPSDAEDVVQTVFLRLMANRHVAGLDEKPTGYLRRAATNAGLDVLRRRKTTRSVPMEEMEPMLESDAVGPQRQVASKELKRALRGALTDLNPTAAQMFTLRYFEGLANPEIAEIMETSAAVVAVTLHRARRTLQQALQDFQGELQ